MNKKIILTLAVIIGFGALALNYSPVYSAQQNSTQDTSGLDKETIYYPNASVKSAVSKYKNKNYTGCLQELFSVTKKNPNNAYAYYYMALAYTHLDMSSEAVAAYEKVIELNSNSRLVAFAAKGKDCLTNGPLCTQPQEGSEEEQLEKFINSPYGNGLSDEINTEIKKKELSKIKDTINRKENLELQDINKIRNFDDKKSYEEEETIKIAQVSDEDILGAVRTLKEAGLNVTVQQNYSDYQDPRMAEMSMMLGNNNGYNYNNNMMNMLPFLMKQAESGENIDPRLMQTMMTSSMMSDLNFNSNNNNY